MRVMQLRNVPPDFYTRRVQARVHIKEKCVARKNCLLPTRNFSRLENAHSSRRDTKEGKPVFFYFSVFRLRAASAGETTASRVFTETACAMNY